MMEEPHLQLSLAWLLIVILPHVMLAFCSTHCNGDRNTAYKQHNSKEPAGSLQTEFFSKYPAEVY